LEEIGALRPGRPISWLRRALGAAPPRWGNPEPIREELFGIERLEQHARSLAVAQPVASRMTAGHSLAPRLMDNERELLEGYRATMRATRAGIAITPAAEWLIDNFHLVEKQIRNIRADLPPGYYRQLPKLATGPFEDYPRVFGVAWAYVAHTDSRFDLEVLRRYVRAYQEVQPLTIGELWAVSITLRIVLIENLRRLAEKIERSQEARRQADHLADRLLGASGQAPEAATDMLPEWDGRPLAKAFVAQLTHRLRDQDFRTAPALTWLDERLSSQGTSADTVVREEQESQVSANVTMRNIITSLRLISEVDWLDLFESISLVSDLLSAGSGFQDMDIATRNHYRSAIEELARGSRLTEIDVTTRALLAAAQGQRPGLDPQDRRSDPGYYLLAPGRRAFEKTLGYSPPPEAWTERLGRTLGITGYGAAIVGVAAVFLAAPLLILSALNVGPATLTALGLLGAVPALDAAVALVNCVVTRVFRATFLPALALREGVPSHLRTLVAVPMLLSTKAVIAEQVEALEIHHLASLEGDVHFALLSDWNDAASESLESDKALLAAASEGVERLNRKYGPAPGGDRFLLLHRRRVWSEGEQRWIGWERKRGKLHELNRLLRGAPDTTYTPQDGDGSPSVPSDIRYVITLDADTRLPRDAVRRLIGKMAHPLNQPRYDSALGRVVEGYGVLQPRVTPSLPGRDADSLFQRIFSSPNGIDPYAAAVSDVYQDLFGEGSYAGKGIYEIDAFEAALAGRTPDATLLSHDLFEGVFARAGLASDVEVIEEFPARYDVASLRHHRWARGDWQLLPWIFGWGGPKRTGGGLPTVGRWKMLDNLRRSLTAPVGVIALFAGWTLPLAAASAWSAFIVCTIAAPAAFPLIGDLLSRRAGVDRHSYLAGLGEDLGLAACRSGLMVVLMAHQAWLMGDAITRTLWRLLVTRRHLLQWVTAAQSASGLSLETEPFYQRMAGGLVIALAALTQAWLFGRSAWPLAVVFSTAWILSPAVARWLSLPQADSDTAPPTAEDALALRRIARRTWRFFETFVTPADNMLPPDNFQEDPTAALAHRTSPTNLGLYLLSVASARDFGWIGTLEAVERIEASMATMGRMARYRGHFYNWYDTRDLRPLDPQYVSTVDSGNLAGHLIALAGACREWCGAAPAAASGLAGVGDALALARIAAEALREGRPSQAAAWRQLDAALRELTTATEGLGGTGHTYPEALAGLAERAEALAADVQGFLIERGEEVDGELFYWVEAARNALASHRCDLGLGSEAETRLALRLVALENAASAIALAMDFGFLLDPDRKLLAIGFLPTEGILDPNCYDLLASEARLASFLAIAKGDVRARHWFRLGHAVTPVGNSAVLISWSGSMFEYLMPSLVMQSPSGSLLDRTTRAIVRRQIEYGAQLGVPWGVSESAFNARDLEFTYQYSNFGIPGLGLKRGLGDNTVIAPYATALAAMVDPQAAVRNFESLAAVGAQGRYGFYEALDYTPERVPEGNAPALVRAFMAHHQGMTIVAIADALLDGAMRRRFHADPMVQATELLLQERMPRDVAPAPRWAAEASVAVKIEGAQSQVARRQPNPHAATPATQLLSNGRYTVMITAAGSGYTRWQDQSVSRWREDATSDNWGSYVFLRDVQSGAVWSAGLQPTGAEPDSYAVTFNEDRAEISRRDGGLTTTLEIVVSAEDDAEVRRVSIVNTGELSREIEITSYAELVLAPHMADVAHPAFSKLFVETEHLAGVGALLATRRRRTPTDKEIWAAHLAVVDGETVGKGEFETDRARFLGRGRSIRAPIAVLEGRPLSGSTGAVLDPIFALRRRVRIAPGAKVRVAFWTMVGTSRKAILDLVDKHHDVTAFDRAATLAWTQAQVQLHHLGITQEHAGHFQRLAGHLIYATPALRPPSETIEQGAGGQPGLWSMGISGDLPIIVLRISDVDHLDIARDLLAAAAYWRMKRFALDVVIINERVTSYVQDLQLALEALVRASQSRLQGLDPGAVGGVYVLRADLVAAETCALLTSVARVVLSAERGSIFEQLDRAAKAQATPQPRTRALASTSGAPSPASRPELEFFNGLGGFADGGRAYVVVLGPGQTTPAPWVNVIANPRFGFEVSADGSGCTWSLNSREHRLTPWSNDPVGDRTGQVFYLRDEETGEVWSPTAAPIRDEAASYVARHGWGYSRFEHSRHGLDLTLVEYVPLEDPVKISRLTIRNVSGRRRRLSLTAYVEWVLGSSRAEAAPFTMTQMDPQTGAMFARNRWTADFASRVAFIDLGARQTSWTADRREFIGRNGVLSNPLALAGSASLSNRVGGGLDPCGALQTTLELAPGESVELVCFLGDAASDAEASALVARYRAADLDTVLGEVRQNWDNILGAVQVETPDRPLDVLLNGWLLYQTLACRLWARSAFYQASGAYGFRDQLQDAMSLAAIRPAITRAHLLRAAARQFVEGDVQHWWLPHSGQGVRTRFADDRIWLAYCAAHYIGVTGDTAVLEEPVAFLEGPLLPAGEPESFFHPTVAGEIAPLYEHCARALDASLQLGGHGLPLFGGGDWNDGMNRVGAQGRGESVWLGWFLYTTLQAFLPLAQARHDDARAKAWAAHMVGLQASLEREAWDGDWYRRGWFDDETPLGSAASEECRIDSIAQSWAVISGAGEPQRAARAMAAVERDLILPETGLALLFAPPFDQTPLDPGYIKAYPAGIRENGGQYTHAALWSVIAFAAMGEGDKAADLLSLLNPINHARTRADVHRYKVEPYVVAADVYSRPPHVGRGGWTWYTGAAGWMQRAGVENVLGLRQSGGFLHLDPCIPKAWPGFKVTLRHETARYEIEVENPNSVSRGIVYAECDGKVIEARPLRLPLVADGQTHHVLVRLGDPARQALA
jgi:cyclic beta-1,2-glucan synthetase